MKNQLNTKLKVIRNEKYFTLSTKLQNARTNEELVDLEKEIETEIKNQEFINMKKEYTIIKENYKKNIEQFSLCEQLAIAKLFNKCVNYNSLSITLPILEARVTSQIEFKKLKEELNSREIVKEKLSEFKKTFTKALPYISHNKYVEIVNEMKKQDYSIYNYKTLDNLIEELNIIIEIEKEYLKNSPGEEKIMFIRKRINKKIL